jgi:hypothetical protein
MHILPSPASTLKNRLLTRGCGLPQSEDALTVSCFLRCPQANPRAPS